LRCEFWPGFVVAGSLRSIRDVTQAAADNARRNESELDSASLHKRGRLPELTKATISAKKRVSATTRHLGVTEDRGCQLNCHGIREMRPGAMPCAGHAGRRQDPGIHNGRSASVEVGDGNTT
jgi:hypothetical protein